MHKFKDTGINSIRCKRSDIKLKFGNRFEKKESIRNFLINFRDNSENQSKCIISDFFMKRFKVETESFLKHAKSLSKPKSKENDGFTKLSKSLNKLSHKDKKATCHFCGTVGDAVIALETPRNMRLEHTDYSFDHLCEIIEQSHYRHPSQSVMRPSSL